MRKKVDYRSASRATYEVFCQNHPNVKISFNEWLEIIYAFNEEFRDLILETGEKEYLPFNLGAFSVTKKKRKIKNVTPNGYEYINLPIDWKKTHEKGKIIYNFNHHTEGYFFGWIWFKNEARFKFSQLWRFKPSRTTSRMLGYYLNSNKENQHKYRHWK